MDKKLTHRAIISIARKDIKALRQPKGLRGDVWYHVQQLLDCLAGYLPEVWPSERTLAKKLGWHQTSVHRAVSRARALGLLETSVRPVEGARFDGQFYLLVCLSDTTKAALVRARPEHISGSSPEHSLHHKVGTSSSKKYEGRSSPSGGVTPVGGCAAERDDLLRAAMAGFRGHPDHDEPRPFGAPPESEDPPLRSTTIKGDPALALARLFDDVWREAAARDKHLRTLKPSSRPIAIKYLKGVMLRQVDVDVAEAYIRQFPARVLSGAVEIPEGKTPFQAFIGSWGDEQVTDPGEEDRLREINARLDARIAARKASLDSGD